MLAYVLDEGLRRAVNGNGVNYWDAYIAEIGEMLGARAEVLSLGQVEDPAQLDRFSALILGRVAGSNLTQAARAALQEWVEDGGVLIGFGVQGLDRVFGIESVGAIQQEPDEYAISAYFELWPHPLTHEVHPALALEQRLFALSDTQLVETKGCTELARLYDVGGRDCQRPAITWNACGSGFAGWFAFDVAKTIWLLHQGRPQHAVYGQKTYPKTTGLQVLGDNSRKIAYADEIALVLQNMIAQKPVPFIHQLPPMGDQVPDALLYWGGDEYHGPTQLSLEASDWMRAHGMGYHINMCYNHPITPQELKHIQDNGHEVSLYFQLHEEDGYAMKEERYREETELFEKKFGFPPTCTVNKWLGWTGWAQPAKWMLGAGVQADNSFFGSACPSDHPLANGPVFAFGFGTAYPFYFYDDHTNANQRIGFLEEPIICYEVGHRGSITGRDKQTSAAEDVHAPVDMAIKYHMTMNMFCHPAYIAGFPRCREAIEEVLRYIEYRGARVLHWGNDAVCAWWQARSRSGFDRVEMRQDGMRLVCRCAYPDGMIVKVPVVQPDSAHVTCDGKPVGHQARSEFGRTWLYVVVPAGSHEVTVSAQGGAGERRPHEGDRS